MKSCGGAGKQLLTSITHLMNFMLARKLCDEFGKHLFGAVLIALKKKDRDIRPIAIGNTFRRLLGCSQVRKETADHLSP